jgi:hypothetical protein
MRMVTRSGASASNGQAGLGEFLRLVSNGIREPSGIASTIAILAGLLLAFLPGPSAPLEAVGYSLVAAGVFAFISQFFAGGLILKQVNIRLVTIGDDLGRRLSNEVQRIRILHLPTDEYPATNAPNPQFNDRYNNDLQRAERILYRGQSGRHLVARLKSVPTPELQQLLVIAEHPFSEEVLAVRAKNQLDRGEVDRDVVTEAEVREKVRRQMLHAIIGLFDLRANFTIQMRYTETVLQVRTEIVGTGTYVTYEPRNQAGVPRFPDAFRFSQETLAARLLRLEFDREFARLRGSGVEFRAQDGDSVLLDHLAALGFDRSTVDLHRARGENNAVSSELATSMEAGRRR